MHRPPIQRASASDDAPTGDISVMVADDDDAVRRTLERIISTSPSLVLVGTARDGDEAIALARSTRPAVALVDVDMPGGGGVRVTEVLRSQNPATRVLALSGSSGRAGVMAMLAAGATGYLVKGSDFDLVSAVQRASRGEGVLAAEVASDVIGELSERLLRQRDVEREQELGIARVWDAIGGGLSMVFQPVVDLGTGALHGYEALARFAGEPRRPPDRWFAEAWEVGLGFELETAAFDAAVEAVLTRPGASSLAVNLSPRTVVDRRFPSLLRRAPGLDRLVIEITEHAVVEDYGKLLAALAPARDLGVKVAVDDAGAGYSSLRHVLMLEPDYVKLDGSLVTGIHTDAAKRAVAVGMVASATELGADVVAEAIEEEAEMTCVAQLGARYGQGYHLGRPGSLPAEEEGR